MVGAFSPEEAEQAKAASLPEAVFETVNSFLAKRSGDREITVFQEEVVLGLLERGFEREQIFADRLLNFEKAYETVGWNVTFDKPAYNETGMAHWVFTRK